MSPPIFSRSLNVDEIIDQSKVSMVAGGMGPKAQEAKPHAGEGTVTMVFPRTVILQDTDHKKYTFPAGTSEVPERLADHWYLAAHGVVPYAKPEPPSQKGDEIIGELEGEGEGTELEGEGEEAELEGEGEEPPTGKKKRRRNGF